MASSRHPIMNAPKVCETPSAFGCSARGIHLHFQKGAERVLLYRRNVSRKDLLSGMSTAVQTKYIALEKTSIVVTNVIRGRSRNRPGSLLYKEASRDAAWPVLSPSAGVSFCPLVSLFYNRIKLKTKKFLGFFYG